ncbi:hypothetical protein PsorP6_012044 [Peronosclerospora sorghi]|uniref:Uncharacterized protein n=1 Tax=Peronosclerospora sorghi TaxID=230839 RepID=A0ACC0WKF6_9STRA|nr:hypothetical protein PsorP6_012044 [Peronosclerospora sorghi]
MINSTFSIKFIALLILKSNHTMDVTSARMHNNFFGIAPLLNLTGTSYSNVWTYYSKHQSHGKW